MSSMSSLTMTGVDFTILMAQSHANYRETLRKEAEQARLARFRQMALAKVHPLDNSVEMHLLDYGQLGSPSHRLDF